MDEVFAVAEVTVGSEAGVPVLAHPLSVWAASGGTASAHTTLTCFGRRRPCTVS
ncbi:hypothetical protein GCM10027294_23700 [Marinactinospora endophytica]